VTAIPLTNSGLRNAKRALHARFPEEKSSHLAEALAAACGFNTHAALLARMQANDSRDPDYVLLAERPFIERLARISGRAVTMNDQSFSFEALRYPSEAEVIKTESSRFHVIDYEKSKRRRAWRNVMVAGINEGIDRRLFTIRPGDNRWPGASAEFGRGETFVFRFSVGAIPAVASVNNAGFDELSVHVALWPMPEGERWIKPMNGGFHAGDVFASGWLERRDGAWLQVPRDRSSGWSFCCRQSRLKEVAALDLRPKGYADRGNFKL
jgi:hypothetical protein